MNVRKLLFAGALVSTSAAVAAGCSAPDKGKFVGCEGESCEESVDMATGDLTNPEEDAATFPDVGIELDTAEPPAPCLRPAPESVDLGAVVPGAIATAMLSLENCGTTDLDIARADICDVREDGTCLPGPVFSLSEDSDAVDFSLSPGETRELTVQLNMPDPANAEHRGEVQIWSADLDDLPYVVPVVATRLICPQAVAEATLADADDWRTEIDTVPMQTIQFRAASSIDPEGRIGGYEWSIIDKPIDSAASFTPSAAVEDPELFLDVAGAYEIELSVFGDAESESCSDSALVSIRARVASTEDIYIELVWDTPTDPDQTDTDGTDLDLHFLHPNGTWNNLPWDVFWNNPNPEWGAPGPDDNPELTVDDTDGAGPEIITLDNPENGITYAVGVYYYAANGYGPSYATVRIFVRGTQEFEWLDMYLPNRHTFWYVATISWPAADIFEVNQVQEGFPSRP